MNVGTLEIQLMANMARLQSDMDKAKRTVGDTVDTMNKVLGAIGVGVSFAGFVSLIKGSIDALDHLNDLRQATGLLAKDMAGLEMAFRQSGLDNSALQKTFVSLSKEIANGGDNLKQLGISIYDASGSAKTSRQIFGELADKFASYEDNAREVNLITEIFGKKMAGLLPVLNGGAESLDEYDKLAAKLGQTVSEKTLVAADRFNDTLDLVSTGANGVSKQIAAEMLPTFMGLTDQFLNSATSGDRLKKIADFLSTGLKGLIAVGLGVVGTFQTVGTAFGGVATMWSAILNGEFAAAREIVRQTKADISTGLKSTLDDMKSAWNANGSVAVESLVETNNKLKQQAILLKDAEEQAKAQEAARKAAALAAKKEAEEKLRFVDALQKEARETGITATALTRLRASYLGVSDAAEVYIQEIERKNRAARIEEMNTQQIVKNLERYKKLTEETQTAQEKYQDQVKYINEARNATDGTAISQETYNRALQKASEEFKKAGETGKTAMNDLDQYAVQASRNIQTSLANFLFDPFNDGLKGMVQGVATAVRRMLAEFAAMKIANSIGLSGLFGLGSSAASASTGSGAAGGGLNLLNIASAGSGLMNLFKGGFGATSLLSSVGGMLPGSVGAFFGGMGGGAITGVSSSASLMGASVGSFLGPIAALGGIDMIGRMLAGDKKLGGAEMIPVIGGFLAAMFGRGPYKFRQQSLQGTISSDGFDGDITNVFRSKGGLFVSNKHKSVTEQFSPEMQALFDSTIGGFFQAAHNASVNLGLDAALVDNFSQEIQIKSEKGQKLTEQAITDMLTGIGDNIAKTALPIVDQFKKAGETSAQTLSRLSGEFTSLSDAASLIFGKSSADARAMISGTSFAGRTAFVDAAGGTDALAQKAAFFSQNFFTSTELLTQSQARLDEQLQALGLSSDLTKDQFRGLVQSFGQVGGISEDLLQSLLNLAPAFVSVRAAEEQLAEQQRQQAAQVQQQRLGLETQLLQLQGNTVELRRREVEALDPANRALQENIFALIDQQAAAQSSAEAIKNSLSDAFTVLQRSVAQEKTRITDEYNKAIAESQKRIDDVTGSISKLKSLSDALKSTTDALRPIGIMQARAQIQDAIANAKNGIFPDAAGIGQALSALSNQNTDRFASRFDFLSSRAQSAGLVDQLGALTANKMTDEQRMLETLQSSKDALTDGFNAQIAQLDGLIASAQQQIDIMNGTYVAIRSVGDALGDLNRTLLQAGAGTIGDGHVSGNPAISNQAIADYFRSARTPDEIFRDASQYGVSSSQIMGATGYTQEQVDKFFADNPRIPRFATGSSYVPRTGPAIVHQGERIINPQQNGDIIDSLKTVARKTEENTNAINNLYRLMRNTVQETTTGFALTTTPA